MKKFIVPAVLLVLAIALFAFLKADPFQPKLDGVRYLSLREEIDEADMAVFAAADDPDEKRVAIAHRDSLWSVLVAMRNLESGASTPAPVKASAKAKESSVEKESSGTNVFVFIIGGLIALVVIATARKQSPVSSNRSAGITVLKRRRAVWRIRLLWTAPEFIAARLLMTQNRRMQLKLRPRNRAL